MVGDFPLNTLFLYVAAYAAILLISMACSYLQAIILQKTGQKIISTMREELFTHIEALSHEQLNEIPVGKLVTRTTNDTNAISLMFTNLLVNLREELFCDLRYSGGHAPSERGADADGALLCALHHSVFRDFPEIHEKGLPEGKGLHDRHQHLPFREPLGHQDHPDLQPGGCKKEEFTDEKQCPRPCQDGSRSSCLASSVRWCICFTSAPCSASSIWAEKVILKTRSSWVRRSASGTDRYFLYVYLEIFRPDSEPGGAVQLAAVGFCFRRKGLHDHRPAAQAHRRGGMRWSSPRSGARSSSKTSGSAMCPASGCSKAFPSM